MILKPDPTLPNSPRTPTAASVIRHPADDAWPGRTARWICGIWLAGAAALHAVTPVPNEVVPEKIPGAKPLNVVFILSDDHRYDAMSFLGHRFAKTPVMDSLAANGAHLKNALVTTALCSPSRASILTGLYTFRHRVIDNNRAKELENKLYRMMGEFGGMEIPLNQPSGASNRIRLRERGGEKASDFPPPMVVDEPVSTNAN